MSRFSSFKELLHEENLEQNNNPAIAYIQSFQNWKLFQSTKFFQNYQIEIQNIQQNQPKDFLDNIIEYFDKKNKASLKNNPKEN